jgi:triphosphoribosyl-dephospho-CoA synthase
VSDPSSPLTPGQLAQIACLLEATARKPGNVHRFRDFEDAHYLDFLLSASAIAGPLDRASQLSLGQTILASARATRRLVATNTNLGMILLLAPLSAVPKEHDLQVGVRQVLDRTTVDDAVHVYQAIRLAGPGGLGKIDEQDIGAEPTISLREAMDRAADRDLVARQYSLGFRDLFDEALPALRLAVGRFQSLETAIIAAFLAFLAEHPDTLIARKRGMAIAREASERAAEVLARGWPDHSDGIEALTSFDDWLRSDGHARNPGATADLITAALFAALRDGTIQLPLRGVWSND